MISCNGNQSLHCGLSERARHCPGGCLWLVVYIPTWESGIVCLLENAFGQEADLGHRIKIQLKRLEPTGLQSGRFQALRGALRTHQPHPPSLLPGHRCCSSNFAQSVLSCKVLACQNHISTLRKGRLRQPGCFALDVHGNTSITEKFCFMNCSCSCLASRCCQHGQQLQEPPQHLSHGIPHSVPQELFQHGSCCMVAAQRRSRPLLPATLYRPRPSSHHQPVT